jgi:predicted Zn-dependent protease
MAVVSSARLDPRFFGEPENPALAKSRLQKLVARHIGKLYYFLPASNSRNSVLCSPMNGLEDLDVLGERF